MTQAFYVMTPVTDIFYLYQKSQKDNYPLFEGNIREYLGGATQINKNIIATLKKDERKNFFYYNNGITVICNNVKPDSGYHKNVIKITKPQVVNGCQTVNSIFEVLNNYEEEEMKNTFGATYVMTKIIVVKDMDKKFYRDIVKYTNSQNAINEKVFGAVNEPFYKIQDNLKKRGILLLVKQSDKETFKKEYEPKDSKGKLIQQVNTLLNKVSQSSIDYEFKKLSDCQVKLELLLQLIGAFEKDAQFAYINKANLLKPTGDIYNSFSWTVNARYTTNEFITIILLYKKIELDRKKDKDVGRGRHPAPYFTLNFLKVLLDKYDKKLKEIDFKNLLFVYEKIIKSMSKKYCEQDRFKELDFHMIVRRKIDKENVKELINKEITNIKQYNNEDYKKLMIILKK